MYEVVFFVDSKGGCPSEEFLDSISDKARGKFLRWVALLGQLGPTLPRPYADILRGKIRELRMVYGGDQFRLLYFFDGRTIVLSHGFVKKSDAVPDGEIRRAEMAMKEHFGRRSNKGV